MRTEINFAHESPWGRGLAALRAQVSDLLKGEIETLARPRAPAAAPAADQGDRAEFHARPERRARNRGADRVRQHLPRLCGRACRQRTDHADLVGPRTISRHLRPPPWSRTCATPASPTGRSGNRSSMPPCASAARCSGRNMPRFCSKRAMWRPRPSGRLRKAEAPAVSRVLEFRRDPASGRGPAAQPGRSWAAPIT